MDAVNKTFTPRPEISQNNSVCGGTASLHETDENARHLLYEALNLDIEGASESEIMQAVSLYRRAAEMGEANAQFFLACNYYEGRGVTLDYTEAVKWFRKAAEQGDASAQFNLGICYENGRGVTQSYEEAVKWYRKAAEQGDAVAQHNLAVCYNNGRGVLGDSAEAVKLYLKSAEQGYTAAQYGLGVYYLEDDCKFKKAVKWFSKAAEQGYADAQYALGDCYYSGIVCLKTVLWRRDGIARPPRMGICARSMSLVNVMRRVKESLIITLTQQNGTVNLLNRVLYWRSML